MKRLTKKLWFGKKRFGWGSRPVSPEGWLVTLLFMLIVIWAADYLRFVENFVFELELEKIYLIGHSFGGGLAALVVAHNPALAKRLILVDAAVVRRERLGLRQQAAKTMAAAKGIFSRLPFADKLRPLAEKIVYRIAGTHDYQKTNGVMRETFKNILAEDLTSSADFIKIPTLLVWGDFDDSTPVEDGRELNRRIGGSILRLVENCGHNPHVTHTTELVRVVSEFIKSGN